jgi:pimeloyl-ACP methyl ester carboxylesterase
VLAPTENAEVLLPDGRKLAYRAYGNPDGRVVVNCHGGLVCGLDVAPFDAAARELGVCIVSPDRPGIGASSPAPGRSTAGWADDVRALLDRFDVERASVLGWSMGGQYALACAARVERIDRAVVIAGALPLDDDPTFAQLNAMDRRLTRVSQDHPHQARIAFRLLGSVARHAPKAWARQMAKDAVPEEASVISALPDPGLATAAAVALRGGRGMVDEYRAWKRPWGFRPEDVGVPTVVWQGDADHLIPPDWGRTLSRRIPGARLELRAGEGHFLGYRHQLDVLRDL